MSWEQFGGGIITNVITDLLSLAAVFLLSRITGVVRVSLPNFQSVFGHARKGTERVSYVWNDLPVLISRILQGVIVALSLLAMLALTCLVSHGAAYLITGYGQNVPSLKGYVPTLIDILILTVPLSLIGSSFVFSAKDIDQVTPEDFAPAGDYLIAVVRRFVGYVLALFVLLIIMLNFSSTSAFGLIFNLTFWQIRVAAIFGLFLTLLFGNTLYHLTKPVLLSISLFGIIRFLVFLLLLGMGIAFLFNSH